MPDPEEDFLKEDSRLAEYARYAGTLVAVAIDCRDGHPTGRRVVRDDEKLDAIAKSIGALTASVNNVRTDVHASIEEVKTEFRAESRGTREIFRRSEETNLAAHAASRRHMARLTSMTTELWRFNFGDKPPPPPPPGSSHDEAALSAVIDATAPTDEKAKDSRPAVRERMASQESDLDTLAGNIVRVAGDVDGMKLTVNELLRLQKEQMGKKDLSVPKRDGVRRIVDALLWAATEREGQKYVGIVASGVVSFITIVVTLVSLITGRPPPIITPPAAVSGGTNTPHLSPN